jgi:hypothetical protein
MRVRGIGWLVIFGLCLSGSGAPVDRDNASGVAARWLRLSPKPMGRSVGRIGKTTAYFNAAGEARFYVVDLEPTGYVVMAVDDELEAVIAFSHEDKFVAQAGSPLFDLLQRDTEGRMRQLRAAASPSTPRVRARGKAKWELLRASTVPQAANASEPADALGVAILNDVRVDPLIQSRWNQSTIWAGSSSVAVYDYYTPPNAAGDPNNYVAGCVATAWAQIMRYHQWPVAGVGTASFAITVDGVAQQRVLRGGNGAGGPYDWANMVLIPGSGITMPQRQAIGALLHDAGVANNMAYAPGGSSAYLHSAAITTVFHYANGKRCSGDLPAILVALRTNLDAGLPVAISIRNSSSGHSVVCDGYGYNLSTLYHHLNMGWSGSNDAWYNLPTVNDSFYGFDMVEDCSYNIDPAISGEIISGRITLLDGTPLAGCPVTITGPSVHTVTTNQRGIFAVKGLNSNTAWTIIPLGSSYVFGPSQATVTTGISTDNALATGDRVVDFQANMVNVPPSIVTQPASQTLLAGKNAAFTIAVVASGTQLLAYQWQKNGGPIAGATNASYTISNVLPADAGSYTCVVTNATGSKTSDPAVLTIAHSADVNGDLRIGLVELTRVIELYNTRLNTVRTGRYKVQTGTEDGFAQDPAATANQTLTRYHSADSNRDGQISLGELTRVIELYNTRAGTARTGQYHVQAGTEDGFAPGP